MDKNIPPMILYQDNPNLEKKVVETFNKQKEYRCNCWKIKGLYYVINKDAFEVEGVRYRLNSGLITYDHELKKMVVLKGKNLTKGIVDFKDGFPIYGFFSANPYNNCQVADKLSHFAINSDILIANKYGENFSTGVWYPLKSVSVKDLQTPHNSNDYTTKGYNIEDNTGEFLTKIELYKNFTPELSKDVRRYGKMLGDTTFGFELECSKGYLPDNLQNQNGVVICRDGSLNDENGKPGPEFVTIPMHGAKGLQTISNIAKELSKRTALDIKCSLHIHLGNIPTTRMYLVSLYKLACKLQNEIFQMFPFYKTNPEGIKQKNYNKKLPSLDILNIPKNLNKEQFEEFINSSYKVIFSWLAEGYVPDININRKRKQHPVNQKWNRKSRYYWLNFMNTIFSERNTIEFRLHTPTTNQQKIVNWLFICNAIIKFVSVHTSKILTNKEPITLNDVLDYYGESFGQRGKFLSEYLKAYVKERKDMFFKDFCEDNKTSDWDITNDKQYEFVYNNVKHLF